MCFLRYPDLSGQLPDCGASARRDEVLFVAIYHKHAIFPGFSHCNDRWHWLNDCPVDIEPGSEREREGWRRLSDVFQTLNHLPISLMSPSFTCHVPCFVGNSGGIVFGVLTYYRGTSRGRRSQVWCLISDTNQHLSWFRHSRTTSGWGWEKLVVVWKIYVWYTGRDWMRSNTCWELHQLIASILVLSGNFPI